MALRLLAHGRTSVRAAQPRYNLLRSGPRAGHGCCVQESRPAELGLTTKARAAGTDMVPRDGGCDVLGDDWLLLPGLLSALLVRNWHLCLEQCIVVAL